MFLLSGRLRGGAIANLRALLARRSAALHFFRMPLMRTIISSAWARTLFPDSRLRRLTICSCAARQDCRVAVALAKFASDRHRSDAAAASTARGEEDRRFPAAESEAAP
jgi:hypothetical protein